MNKVRLSIQLFVYLIVFKAVIRFFPFKYYHRLNGEYIDISQKQKPIDKQVLKNVLDCIKFVEKIVFFNFNCYAKALSVKRVLNNKGYSPILVFGLCNNNKNLRAHAWLEINDEIIIGTDIGDISLYKSVSKFI